MLWVYGLINIIYYSAGIDFSRQILTTKVGPGAERVKPYSANHVYMAVFSLVIWYPNKAILKGNKNC